MPRIQQFVPLLRPWAAPSAAACRQHLRFSAATRLCTGKPSKSSIQSSKPTAPQADSVPTPPPLPPTPTPPPATNTKTAPKPTMELTPPKYRVSRSHNKNLPVYTDFKRGGNLHLTIIRNITGDLSALRDEIRMHLDKANEDVRINSLTAQIVVKGHHKAQIQTFLEHRGM